jgi:hypothetical protein
MMTFYFLTLFKKDVLAWIARLAVILVAAFSKTTKAMQPHNQGKWR